MGAFRFGGAKGVDTECAWAVHDIYPDADRLIVIPAAPWSRVVPPGTRVVYAPEGRDVAESYMNRNLLLVGYPADVLIAFPRSGRERVRSGTWATVRRARKRGIEVRVSPLNGDEPWIESAADQLPGVSP